MHASAPTIRYPSQRVLQRAIYRTRDRVKGLGFHALVLLIVGVILYPAVWMLSSSFKPSSDIVGNPASCVFDSKLTMSTGQNVKILGWYDNEWGYSNRTVDLVRFVGEKL